MKKHLFTYALAGMLPLASMAQTGSTTLKDGTGTAISSYNSIGAAYAAIPASLTQAYTIEINSSYTGANETYPVTFTAKTGASSANTITLRPAAGVANVVISGSYVNTDANGGIIQLNDADYVIIDGRAGGIGTTSNLTITNTSTAYYSYSVQLRANATNNTIRYCNITNATTTNVGCNIDAIEGASNNVVEYTTMTGSRYGVRWAGSSGNMSQNNKIYGCDFVNITFTGFWGRPNLGKITIDSCRFYNTAAASDSPYGLLFDSQTDTVTISRNKIYNIYNSGTTAVKGIEIRSVTGTNYFRIYNNFISLSPSTSTTVMGINLAATSVVGNISFNSIRMTGTLASGGTAGSVSSACINKANNAANYTIMNNLCVNDRTGGAGLHVGANYVDQVNTTADYNTYNSATGNLVRYANTNYTTIITYQGAVSGNEAHANPEAVNFVSATDLHLTGTSLNNVNLAGITIPFITTDIDGATRSATPTRGAHESSGPPCTGNPAAAVITGPAGTICGTATTFTLTATGQTAGSGISYKWQSRTGTAPFADITSATAASLTTTAAQTTDYRFVTTCSSPGSVPSNSNVITVTVLAKPTATVTAGGPLTFCTGGSVVLTTPTGTGFTYQWQMNNTNITSATANTYTATTSGNYRVIVANGTCADTSAVSAVTVTTAPPATVTPAGPTTFCQGGSVLLNANTGSGYTYQWQNGGAAIPGATAASYVAVAAGTYTVVVTSGCSATSTGVTVTVNPAPPAVTVTAAGPAAFCAGGSVVLNASSGNNYQWLNSGNNITGATSAAYTASASGTYRVRVTGTNGCSTVSDSVVVTVFPVPAPSITRIGNTLSIATGYLTYQWYKGSAAIPGATTFQYTVTRDGLYSVRVTDNAACSGSSAMLPINNLATGNVSPGHDVIVYPNPAGQMVYINAPVKVNIAIRGIDGKLVMSADGVNSINIARLANGIYTLYISDQNHQVLKIEKLVKSAN